MAERFPGRRYSLSELPLQAQPVLGRLPTDIDRDHQYEPIQWTNSTAASQSE